MIELRVYKSRRLLEAAEAGRVLFRVPVTLGSAPLGHKQQEGDGRTPEGRYRVCTRNEASRFHLALGLSYPNAADGEAALAAGRISAAQADDIRAAEENGKRPPWDTDLGGAIMLHGQRPDTAWDPEDDWTAGCVSLRNEDMDRLWALCPLGTPVTIFP